MIILGTIFGIIIGGLFGFLICAVLAATIDDDTNTKKGE